MKMHVLLDLWGVLLDSAKMNREYNQRAAFLLSSRLGGGPSAWLDAYNSSWDKYLVRIASAEAMARDWKVVVDELDADLILETMESVGVDWRPPNIMAFSRDLEEQVAASVARCHPGAKRALHVLREADHKVYVATQAGDWNARAALRSVGLSEEIDGIFSGNTQRAFKSSPRYWRDIPRTVGAAPGDIVLVDDRLDYLETAFSVGFAALFFQKGKKPTQKRLPGFVSARLSSLSQLPPLVESLAHRKVRGKPGD